MEHNIHKTIQRKVNEAELYPVRWKKEEVWQRMAIKPTPRSKRPLYFSIAASLLVALLAGIYSYQHFIVTTSSQEKISTGQTKPENRQAIDDTSSEKKYEQEYKEGKQHDTSIANTSIEKNQERKITSEFIQPQTTLAQDTTIVYVADITEAASTDSILYMNNASVAQENTGKTVKVILGVIPQEEPHVVIRKEKKVKIKLFNSEKDKFPENSSEESKLIIARIN